MKRLLPFAFVLLCSCNYKGILRKSISIENLRGSDTTKTSGAFQTYVTNDSLYLEAKSTFISKDSIVLSGSFGNKTKSDTLDFEMVINLKGTSNKIRKVRGSYILTIDIFEPEFSHKEFVIKKSKNYVVQDGLLNMYTGKITDTLGNSYNYVVLDDPNYIDMPIGTVGYLVTVAGKRIDEYKEKCRATYRNNCHDYKLKFSHGFITGTRTQIYCDCKN